MFGLCRLKIFIKMFDKVRAFVLNFMLPSSRSYPLLTFRRERAARKVNMAVKGCSVWRCAMEMRVGRCVPALLFY
jgi:hypothetical protein